MDSDASTVHTVLCGPIVMTIVGRNAPGSPSIRSSWLPPMVREKPASVVPLMVLLLPDTMLTSRMKGKMTCLRMATTERTQGGQTVG